MYLVYVDSDVQFRYMLHVQIFLNDNFTCMFRISSTKAIIPYYQYPSKAGPVFVVEYTYLDKTDLTLTDM